MSGMMRATPQRLSHTAIRATAVALVVIVLLFAYHQKYKIHSLVIKYLLFVAQIMSGNWSPDVTNIDQYSFVAGSILAVILNVVTIIGVSVAAYNFYVLKRLADMDQMTAFDLRSAEQKDRLLFLLGPEIAQKYRSTIEQAFEQGDKIWRDKTLRDLFGVEGAQQFLAKVDKANLHRTENERNTSHSFYRGTNLPKPKP